MLTDYMFEAASELNAARFSTSNTGLHSIKQNTRESLSQATLYEGCLIRAEKINDYQFCHCDR